MADSKQVTVTKGQQELRKALNGRVTAGSQVGEDNSEHPCSHQWDRGFPAPGSLSREQFCETPRHRGTPHIHETKAVQSWCTCWRGRAGSTEYVWTFSRGSVRRIYSLHSAARQRKSNSRMPWLLNQKQTYRRVWEHTGVPKSQHQHSAHGVV